MTTLQTFNNLLRAFIEELAHTFPEDPALAVAIPSFDQLAKANIRKPLELFNETIGPHAALVMAKDPALFEQQLSIGGTVDLGTYWATPDLSDASREAIWKYLQSLLLLSSTVSALPEEMLSAIETMAQDVAGKVASGDLDLTQMTSMLLGGDGAASLGALLSGMPGTPGTTTGTPAGMDGFMSGLANIMSSAGAAEGFQDLASMLGSPHNAAAAASALGSLSPPSRESSLSTSFTPSLTSSTPSLPPHARRSNGQKDQKSARKKNARPRQGQA